MEEWTRYAITALGGLWLSTITWIGKRQVERIDNAATKEDLESMLDRFEDQIRIDRESREKIHEKLNTISSDLGYVKGKVSVVSKKDH